MTDPAKLADDHPCTLEEAAVLNFEPWQHADDEWKPPSRVEWAELTNTHLIALHFAWAMMFKTKEELGETVVKLYDDEGDLASELFEMLDRTATFFEALSNLANGASARLLIAASAAVSANDNDTKGNDVGSAMAA